MLTNVRRLASLHFSSTSTPKASPNAFWLAAMLEHEEGIPFHHSLILQFLPEFSRIIHVVYIHDIEAVHHHMFLVAPGTHAMIDLLIVNPFVFLEMACLEDDARQGCFQGIRLLFVFLCLVSQTRPFRIFGKKMLQSSSKDPTGTVGVARFNSAHIAINGYTVITASRLKSFCNLSHIIRRVSRRKWL